MNYGVILFLHLKLKSDTSDLVLTISIPPILFAGMLNQFLDVHPQFDITGFRTSLQSMSNQAGEFGDKLKQLDDSFQVLHQKMHERSPTDNLEVKRYRDEVDHLTKTIPTFSAFIENSENSLLDLKINTDQMINESKDEVKREVKDYLKEQTTKIVERFKKIGFEGTEALINRIERLERAVEAPRDLFPTHLSIPARSPSVSASVKMHSNPLLGTAIKGVATSTNGKLARSASISSSVSRASAATFSGAAEKQGQKRKGLDNDTPPIQQNSFRNQSTPIFSPPAKKRRHKNRNLLSDDDFELDDPEDEDFSPRRRRRGYSAARSVG